MNPLIKILAVAVVVFMITTGVFFGLWRYEVKSHKIDQNALVQADATIAAQKENLQLSERTSNAYQSDINRLNTAVKRLRARPARCIAIVGEAGVHTEPGSGGGHDGRDGQGAGIDTEWLRDYAIEAERHRIDKNACIDFVNQNWENASK